jgi:hypothetical protein
MAEESDDRARRLSTKECNAVLIPVVVGLGQIADREELRRSLLDLTQHFDELLAAASVLVESSAPALTEYLRKKDTPADA